MARDYAGALRTAETIPVPEERRLWIAWVVKTQARGGDLQGALETQKLITDADARKRADWVIAVARAQHGDPAEAFAAIGAIPDPWVRVMELVGIVGDLIKPASKAEWDPFEAVTEAIRSHR